MQRFQVIDQNGMICGPFLSPDLDSFLKQYDDGRWGQAGQFSILLIPDDAEFIREQRSNAYPSFNEMMEAFLEHETENRSEKWAALTTARAAVKAAYPKPAAGSSLSPTVVYPLPPPQPVIAPEGEAPPVVAQDDTPAAPVAPDDTATSH